MLPTELDRLKDSRDSLVKLISKLDVDVFVPLYANTFPLASVAKEARERGSESVSVKYFDWGWDRSWSRGNDGPPFLSAREHQLFFATQAEFKKIHHAGISFVAIPVTVFHPRHIFFSPVKSDSNLIHNEQIEQLQKYLEPFFTALRSGKDFDTVVPAMKKHLVAYQKYKFTWISDTPSQSEFLASNLDKLFSDDRKHEPHPIVRFWQDRDIEKSLGLTSPKKADNKKTNKSLSAKAFIWGGPLTSAALQDSHTRDDEKRRYGWPRLRDIARTVVEHKLPGLLAVLNEQDVLREHVLYCCVGYKEGRELQEYYVSESHRKDKSPWSLDGVKYKKYIKDKSITDDDNPKLYDLIESIERFFLNLFDAAAVISKTPPIDKTNAYNDAIEKSIFEEFRRDYDKHCRTINPVAQIYTAAEYIECLSRHHDEAAFDIFFPRKESNRIL